MHLADETVDIDHQPLRAGSRTGPPRARDRLGQQPVELADMPERERAQEGPQGGGRRQPAAQQPPCATGSEQLAVIDRVGTQQHREDQRHHLAPRVRRPRPLAPQPHQPPSQTLDPQPLRKRGDQRNPRVRNNPLIVKDDLQAVQSDRLVIMHHLGDLLTQAPDCAHSRAKGLLRRSFKFHPRTERVHYIRWIQA